MPVQQADDVIWQSDADEFDQFGFSVDLHADRMIVGSIGADGASENSGAAYILERSPTTGRFLEVAKVWNNDPNVNQFGWRVALHDDFAAASSPFHAPPAMPLNRAGAILVYHRDVNGDWSEADQLFASDGHQTDDFGTSLAASSDTLIVGAPSKKGVGFEEGAAYVFERAPAGTWSETAKLTASNATLFDQFGVSVDVDQDIAVVGAPRLANVVGLENRYGSAYVFQRDSNGNWTEQIELRPSDATFRDFFGYSVAVSGDTIVVGAPGHSEQGQFPGAAYVFQQFGGQWQETAKLMYLGNDFWYPTGFGYSVDIDQGLMIVAGGNNFSGVLDRRVVVAYEQSTFGQWQADARLTADGFFLDGSTVLPISVSGRTVVIGDYFAPNGMLQTAGATLVYDQIVPEPSTVGSAILALLAWGTGIRRSGISSGRRLP